MAKETGSPKLLFENLDLTPIHSILWTDLHTEGPGRPVDYGGGFQRSGEEPARVSAADLAGAGER